MASFEPIPVVFLIVFAVYFLIILLLTFLSYKKTDSVKEFIIAGSTAGAFMTGISYFATQFSMSSLMGVPGDIFTTGFAGLGVILPIAMFSMGFGVLLVGGRLQKLNKKLDIYTIPDYVGSRYESNAMRIISSLIIIVFMIPFMAAQVLGAGLIFNVFTGAPYWIGVLGMGVIVLIYSMLGGMNAAIFTNTLQGVIMVVASIGTFIAVANYGGGLGTIMEELRAINPGAMSFPGSPVEYMDYKGYVSQILIWTLFSIGQPQLVNKYLVAKSYKSLLSGSVISGTAMTITCVTIWVAGVLAIVIAPEIDIANSDSVIPLLLGNVMHPILASAIAAGILAAGMSTIDSMLVVTSSAYSRDVYQKVLKPDVPDEKVLNVSRITTFVVGALVLVLALLEPAGIFELVVFAWSGNGIMALPILVGLYWKRATKQGAIVAVIAGVTLLISSSTFIPSLALGFAPIVVSAIISLILLVVVSLLTSPPSEKVLNSHFSK